MYERVPEQQHREMDIYAQRPNDLQKLSDMEDWHVAPGEPDIRGWKVVSKDKPDDQIGSVDDLLVSKSMDAAIMAIVSYGGFWGMGETSTLVPIDRFEIDRKNNRLLFLGNPDDLRNAPKYNADMKDFGPFYDYWSGHKRAPSVETRVQKGWGVYDRAGKDQIGEVQGMVANPPANRSPLVIVQYGGFWSMGNKQTLIPLDHLNVDQDKKRVLLQADADELKNAPDYKEGDKNFDSFYDYWSGRRMQAAREHREARPQAVMGEERVIPEVEEHMEVAKREGQVGEVQVRKVVETHPETANVTLHRTRVHVYRRPVSRDLRPGEKVLEEGEVIEIPVSAQTVETRKRTEVVGEVVIQPETVEERRQVSADVRREHVEVESTGDVDLEEEEAEERAHRR